MTPERRAVAEAIVDRFPRPVVLAIGAVVAWAIPFAAGFVVAWMLK